MPPPSTSLAVSVDKKSEMRFSIFRIARAATPSHPCATRSCLRSGNSYISLPVARWPRISVRVCRQSNKLLVKALTRALSISPPSSLFRSAADRFLLRPAPTQFTRVRLAPDRGSCALLRLSRVRRCRTQKATLTKRLWRVVRNGLLNRSIPAASCSVGSCVDRYLGKNVSFSVAPTRLDRYRSEQLGKR